MKDLFINIYGFIANEELHMKNGMSSLNHATKK